MLCRGRIIQTLFAPHGDGWGGVFGNPPFVRHSSVRLVSGESHALRPVIRAKRRLMRTESRAFTPGVPCNTTAAHHAAPLGSRRRSAPPLNFATRNLQKWQEVNEDELRDEIFTSNFQPPFSRGAFKVGFKQKLVTRVTRVAHVPRWSKIQVRSPGACRLQGRLQARSAQNNFQSPFRCGALKVAFKVA